MKDLDIFTTDLFPYLEGEELKGSTLTLTINDIRQEKMKSHKGKDEKKWVLYFQETRKGFVINKTNAKRLAVLYGKMTGGWHGKKITLYTEEVKAFGETHNSLRVAEAAPTNGNGEMTLEKLLGTLEKVARIKGFYGTSSIMACRPKSSTAPAPDDTEGWRQLFVDARDYAFEQLDQAIREGEVSPDQIPMSETEAVRSAAADDLEEQFPEIYNDKSG